jgi:hypothetical protein
MQQAVKCRLERFCNSTNKEEKDAVILEVVNETHTSGGRFLKEDPGKNGWWEEVDQEVAHSKVRILFRDLKSRAKAGTTTIAPAPPAATTATAAPASRLPQSRSSPVGSLQQAWCLSLGHDAPLGPSNPGAARPISAVWNQEFDSSTYEFLEQFSSRGRKRHKGDNNDCGCFF